MQNTTLTAIIEDLNYEELGAWRLPELARFSGGKTLFEYQADAVKSIAKTLHLYYAQAEGGDDAQAAKRRLAARYYEHSEDGRRFAALAVKQYDSPRQKRSGVISKRFALLQNYFRTDSDGESIDSFNFINRACFWMATGSGKSLVLIKTIELTDYLMAQGLIPRRDIMLLLPRDDLINQFMKTIDDYNRGRARKIEPVNLKRYDDDKHAIGFGHTIKVYYYRSDLLRDERKKALLDYKNYDNRGRWYVFLDEAHRGEKQNSKLQDYIAVLARGGFLFNFSATFTDDMDYMTTCYNFNLEKFISAGYGKNIYLSRSYYDFARDNDDFSARDKQKQVMKSLLAFTAAKKSRKSPRYHAPLLMTLVNSVNTEDSDLKLFFDELEKISSGKADEKLFEEAKAEICSEWREHPQYVLGGEKLAFNAAAVKRISIRQIFSAVFNSGTQGRIEILPGEAGKEIALKLETSDSPFALIKIGDTGKFERNHLGDGYRVTGSYQDRNYFAQLNEDERINLLLGSRSFYEGWDSNRPNVVNLINIGKRDAKKFVLQAIGRGARIEPTPGDRQRLPSGSGDKNRLLETLFVFATDKQAVKAIVEQVSAEKKSGGETEISLQENPQRSFNLLIPFYKEESVRRNTAKFNIAEQSRDNIRRYVKAFKRHTLMIKTGCAKSALETLLAEIEKDSFFQIRNENVYSDMDRLLARLIAHLAVKSKVVDKVDKMRDEIIHFKHIKVNDLSDEEIQSLRGKILKVTDFKDAPLSQEAREAMDLLKHAGLKVELPQETEQFKDLVIQNIASHYYLPLIYSTAERADYISHVIKVQSEVTFVKNLVAHVQRGAPDFHWMFSKIDESKDRLHIPYYYGRDNIYRKFYPDFVFWMQRDNRYKIVFVDPKGVNNAEYQNKADEFEKLFMADGRPKVFKYRNLEITCDLKLVAKDVNEVAEKYRKFWIGQNDFSFLRFESGGGRE